MMKFALTKWQSSLTCVYTSVLNHFIKLMVFRVWSLVGYIDHRTDAAKKDLRCELSLKV